MQRDPQHLAGLLAFKMNDMHPFSVSQDDLGLVCLEQAHAIAVMLGGAYGSDETMTETNGQLVRSAFEGIATLVALSQFALHGGQP